jgi:hypothetical protein
MQRKHAWQSTNAWNGRLGRRPGRLRNHRKKDCRRQQQIEEQIHGRENPTLRDCIQGLIEIVAPSPTNQGTQEESQSLPSSGSNTTSSNSNGGSPGSSEGNSNGGTQSQESHDSHEPKSNPNSNSGPMDRNQNKAPNESKQDFGQARQN